MQKCCRQRYLGRDIDIQLPHNRQRHDEHHSSCDHIWNRYVSSPRDRINTGTSLN